MSELLVTSIYNQEGEGAPSFPKGATVTGVITATSFSGSGANLTGIENNPGLRTDRGQGRNTIGGSSAGAALASGGWPRGCGKAWCVWTCPATACGWCKQGRCAGLVGDSRQHSGAGTATTSTAH